jgi:hypothetical protein
LCEECVSVDEPQYCEEEECSDCANKSPEFKAKKKEAEQRFVEFKSKFDVEAWKKTHKKIDYPGRHTGKYLIDIYFSDNNFDHGYIDWLLKQPCKNNGYSKAQNQNFAHFVEEAREIKKKEAEFMRK